MVILALDTTSRGGSCAVVRGEQRLAERAGDETRPQGSRVPADMQAVLTLAGVGLDDIAALAVAVGPGSFTGLRVGIAAMQGLAFATGKPLAGISALDALSAVAQGSFPGYPVTAWVDAWRGDVYAADYPVDGPGGEPTVSSPHAWLLRLDPAPRVFIGDAAATYAHVVRAARGDRDVLHQPPAPRLAAVVGRLAAARLEAGHPGDPGAITPLYVRRPDVELAREVRR